MRLLLLVLVLLLISLSVIWVADVSPGEITLLYRDWIFETSIAAVAIGACLVLTLALILARVLLLPFRLLGYGRLADAHARRANQLAQGVCGLLEGRWQQAERGLKKLRYRPDGFGMSGVLLSARVAQASGNWRLLDVMLESVVKRFPKGQVAAEVMRAEAEMTRGEHAKALATLEVLYQVNPDNTHILSLLCQVLYKLAHYQRLGELLPKARHQCIFDPTPLSEMDYVVFRTELANCDDEVLLQQWRSMPQAVKGHTEVLTLLVTRLSEQGQLDQIEKILREQLQVKWDDSLVALYGDVHTKQVTKQLQVAEGWLASHPKSVALLLALGHLSVACKLWGKARSYFEGAIALAPSPQAMLSLAELLDQLGHAQEARQCYMDGLRLSGKR